jgi:hypothetical protein
VTRNKIIIIIIIIIIIYSILKEINAFCSHMPNSGEKTILAPVPNCI